ncbi:hypothetical protein IEO21_03069 [Rhodonia placenta]|uniref:N-acetyltransferase domain-containing protein n=1 Tax=Rhodonia placenta TaxID=104341 RepID=A0A8H7U3U4_9APHY|nr:hypothetical protein IEO21_03069 [Postia placenta]
MSHSQLHPLQVNPATGEPYLRLGSPLENIILTPQRPSDVAYNVPILNNPDVVRWLEGLPYPYTPSHAESWVSSVIEESDAILRELREASAKDPEAPLKIVGGCPVRILREIKEDGSEVYLGDIAFRRCDYLHVAHEERLRLSEENARRQVGDPALVWCIGYYLASSHHGRGIMTMALRTLLSAWAILRMGVRRIRAEVFMGNIGSVRVFEKNGFVLDRTLEIESPNCLGEMMPGCYILWWEHP